MKELSFSYRKMGENLKSFFSYDPTIFVKQQPFMFSKKEQTSLVTERFESNDQEEVRFIFHCTMAALYEFGAYSRRENGRTQVHNALTKLCCTKSFLYHSSLV